MTYVQRDETGTINGTSFLLSEGVAEEFLEDDNPEVVAFNAMIKEVLGSNPVVMEKE